MVNIAIWLTPVFYPLSIVPVAYQDWVYILNPMAAYIDFLRFGLFGVKAPSFYTLIIAAAILLLLLVGFLTFIRKERNLVDTV
ncbi:MAG: hypothetical protein Salg2KO_15810 [Salibacteraceae bacterium]